MMEIRRHHYLDRLCQFLDAPAVTAVTGIRRAGKSVLLRQFAASLRAERQVVYVDKESFAFESVRTARDLIDHVDSTTRRGEPRVVIVDEVQQIADWERAVASLNGEDRTEVVISGSNATTSSPNGGPGGATCRSPTCWCRPPPSSASSRRSPRFATRIPGCCSRLTRTSRPTSKVCGTSR